MMTTVTSTMTTTPDPNASADWPTISFFIPGDPVTKGDHVIRKTANGFPVLRDRQATDAKPWVALAKDLAHRARGDHPVFDEALRVSMVVLRMRPKGHYGSGKNAGKLKATAPSYPTSAPDLDKLQRRLGDALEGVIWRNDAQISGWNVRRRWGAEAGMLVTVEPEHD